MAKRKTKVLRKWPPSDKPKDQGRLLKYEWPKELREYIISQLGAYRHKVAIYKEITDSKFYLKHGFDGLNPEYQDLDRFKKCCAKIKRTEIEKAHKSWMVNWRGIPYATSKGRVVALNEMINILKDIKNDRSKYHTADLDVTITELVNNIRKLLKDIRLEMDAESEREAKAASGTNIYIGKNLIGKEINAEFLNDTFIALYAEFGEAILGLQHWNLEQLNKLKLTVEEAINSKQQTIEADFEVVEESNESDSD